MELADGVTNLADDPFLLARIDRTGAAVIDPLVATLIDNTAIGVILEIPAGSSTAAGVEVTVTELPDTMAPAGLEPCQVVIIDPAGLTFDPPALITFENRDGLAPGDMVDIWSQEPVTGLFEITGTGQVTADGLRIETILGGIGASGLPPAVPPAPMVVAGADHNATNLTLSLLKTGIP